MKKLIIALVAVAMASASSASIMKWNSGNLYTPTSAKDGKFTETQISVLNSVKAVLWESSTASIITQLAAGGLYEAYKAGTTADTFAGATVTTGANSSKAYAANINGGTYDTGTSVYAAILYVYDDADGNTYYIENYAQNTAAASAKTTKDLASVIGGNGTTAGGSISGWTPVPEPTSGLLLVLGMAGLALKRKRA